jgi:hypothetical protein
VAQVQQAQEQPLVAVAVLAWLETVTTLREQPAVLVV